MKTCLIILWIAILGTGISCKNNDSISNEEKETIVNEIESLLEGYPQAIDRRDIQWIEQLYADHPDFIVALDAGFITDREKWIKETYVEGLSNLDEILHFSFHDGKAHVINEDYAVYTTKFDWGLVMASDTIQSRGSGTYVFMRDGAYWRALNISGTHEYY